MLKPESPDNKKIMRKEKIQMHFCLFFFFFFVYAAHSTRNKTHFFFHSRAPCKCDQRTVPGAPITVVSAHPHTHIHTHIQADMRKAMYIYTTSPKQCKVSWPVQVSFVCKMKARSQNADQRPAQLDRLAATCSTNAVFGQLKKHQKKKKDPH